MNGGCNAELGMHLDLGINLKNNEGHPKATVSNVTLLSNFQQMHGAVSMMVL